MPQSHCRAVPLPFSTFGVGAAWALISATLVAGDWPQILGPGRNGVAVEERLADTLPSGGPKVVWQRPVGRGFSGVAVKGDTVVLFHRDGNSETVEAMSALDGTVRWKQSFPTSYVSTISPDDGPRCVPVIHADAVYLFGASGNLHAVGLKDGKPRWTRRTHKEFNASEGYFGAGSTPIVEGDKLLVNVGGDNAGVVAFRLTDGQTVWKSASDAASYSSPVAVTRDGVRHVIFVMRLTAASFDPETGGLRWKLPFGQRGPTVNGASPVVVDDHVFLTASYGIGAVYARFGKASVEAEWKSDESISSQYTTPVAHGGDLYGIDGRDDVGTASLKCIDPKTGAVRWTQSDFGKATLILADGKLVALKTDGTLVLAEASPKAYRELGRAKVLDETTRALPALASGRLYVRDSRTLKCLDLGAP